MKGDATIDDGSNEFVHLVWATALTVVGIAFAFAWAACP